MIEDGSKLRLDKWLWYARFFKSRTLASKICETGRIRVNSDSISKARYGVRPGDVLTFPQGKDVRVIRIMALGTRRGPASEAQELYEDLSPVDHTSGIQESDAKIAVREAGAGRPTKKERRKIDQLMEID